MADDPNYRKIIEVPAEDQASAGPETTEISGNILPPDDDVLRAADFIKPPLSEAGIASDKFDLMLDDAPKTDPCAVQVDNYSTDYFLENAPEQKPKEDYFVGDPVNHLLEDWWRQDLALNGPGKTTHFADANQYGVKRGTTAVEKQAPG